MYIYLHKDLDGILEASEAFEGILIRDKWRQMADFI